MLFLVHSVYYVFHFFRIVFTVFLCTAGYSKSLYAVTEIHSCGELRKEIRQQNLVLIKNLENVAQKYLYEVYRESSFSSDGLYYTKISIIPFCLDS